VQNNVKPKTVVVVVVVVDVDDVDNNNIIASYNRFNCGPPEGTRTSA